MSKQAIRRLIEARLPQDGLVETGIDGVQLFRVTSAVPCTPAVYEPTVVAIVSGTKEAVLDGRHYAYDSSRYLCCPMTLPVEAGTPAASPEDPLLGVMIALDPRVMTDLAIEMDNAAGARRTPGGGDATPGLTLARWDDGFSDALLRLLLLADNPADRAVLGSGRLRELFYAVLKGDAGSAARRAFGVGNAIARAIRFLSAHLTEPVTIEDMADHAGMSRAVFHRRFKEATTMSPIQFVKHMRLNNAAMKIASGVSVNRAALDVGYVSPSQFNREFKRLYGQPPRQWSAANQLPAGLV